MGYIRCGIRCGIQGGKYSAPTVGVNATTGVYSWVCMIRGDDFSYFRFQFCFRTPLITNH